MPREKTAIEIIGQMNMLRMGYLGFKMEIDSNDFNVYYGLTHDYRKAGRRPHSL
jgi:hypothetical protein